MRLKLCLRTSGACARRCRDTHRHDEHLSPSGRHDAPAFLPGVLLLSILAPTRAPCARASREPPAPSRVLNLRPVAAQVLLLKIHATKSCAGASVPSPAGVLFFVGAIDNNNTIRAHCRLTNFRAHAGKHSVALTPHPPRGLVAAGISLRTQELYAVVFVCRYLDLFFSFISVCVLSAVEERPPGHTARDMTHGLLARPLHHTPRCAATGTTR